MSIPLSLLCPIDFSSTSLDALHYALAIGRRFDVAVTVLAVDDALLADVGDARMGHGWSRANSERELRALVNKAQSSDASVEVNFEVRTGKAAPAILAVAKEAGCQAIVMGTHGRSGVGKWLFGATAERVLRETTLPVLLVPTDPAAPGTFEDLTSGGGPLLVPVDFGSATNHQVSVANWIADTLHRRLVIGHVVEPIDLPVPEQINEAEITSERHRRACSGLQSIALRVPMKVRPEILIASGPPAETIAKWVVQTHAGLLIMALHGDVSGGTRIGSVTYRAIALSRVLTLALPPEPSSPLR